MGSGGLLAAPQLDFLTLDKIIGKALSVSAWPLDKYYICTSMFTPGVARLTLEKMDPRTGSFGESKQPRRPNGAKPAGKQVKLKSVTLSVEWGYEIHSLTIGPLNWAKIQAGASRAVGRKRIFRSTTPEPQGLPVTES